ncbi:MAG TPA: hypothetical protein VFV73_04990 [Streptosporangiaceae bacterium]|nr:hypothetical protein [Streptosporangiaceae bacterium]
MLVSGEPGSGARRACSSLSPAHFTCTVSRTYASIVVSTVRSSQLAGMSSVRENPVSGRRR